MPHPTHRPLLLASLVLAASALLASGAGAQQQLQITDIEGMEFPSLKIGDEVSGTLSTDDLFLWDDTYADAFSFDGRAGEQITIVMRSSAFDAWVMFDDPNSDMLEHDDDSAGGTDSRLTVTIPHDGRYIILANSVATSQGAYTLRLERGP